MQNVLMLLFLTDLPKNFKNLGKSVINKGSFLKLNNKKRLFEISQKLRNGDYLTKEK